MGYSTTTCSGTCPSISIVKATPKINVNNIKNDSSASPARLRNCSTRDGAEHMNKKTRCKSNVVGCSSQSFIQNVCSMEVANA